MKPGATTRMAVVISHPTQYYSPWFRWLAAHTSIDFRVFYLWDFGVTRQRDPQFGAEFKWDVDLLSGYPSEFVPNTASNPGAESFWGFNNPSLSSRLDGWKPDTLLLFGYKWASHLRAAAWAWRRRVPVIFRGDSNFLGRKPRLSHRIALRMLYSRFAAFLYVGAANRDYFAALGVPPARLFFAPHSVDASLFDPAAGHVRADAVALRKKMGLADGALVALFAGKMLPGKRPMELLEAFLALSRPKTALVFVGEGPERAALEAAARSRAPAGTVHFLSFANQSEMPSRYKMADMLAFPSEAESWGLVVNEAMHMGVPCLVSDRMGCQADLVSDGETGWVFRSDRPGSLRDRLAAALDELADPAKREAMERAVLARISRYTYEGATLGLEEALLSL